MTFYLIFVCWLSGFPHGLVCEFFCSSLVLFLGVSSISSSSTAAVTFRCVHPADKQLDSSVCLAAFWMYNYSSSLFVCHCDSVSHSRCSATAQETGVVRLDPGLFRKRLSSSESGPVTGNKASNPKRNLIPLHKHTNLCLQCGHILLVLNSSLHEPLSCTFQLFPCFGSPDFNERVIDKLVQISKSC